MKYCLGIEEFDIFTHESSKYLIIQENKKLEIVNKFFLDDNIESLYRCKNLPEIEKNDVCLYGCLEIITEGKTAKIQGDIIASTFLMVSQWYQFLETTKDAHNRVIRNNTIIGENDLDDSPLVNEYAKILLNVMQDLGMEVSPKKWNKPIMSHDIDQLYKWKSTRNLFGAIKSNLPNVKEIYRQTKSYLKSRKNHQNDQYYNYELLLEGTRKHQIDSTFFLKTGISNPIYDNNDYEVEKERKFLKRLQEEEVEIGIHFSYESCSDLNIMKHEKERLENAIKKEVKSSRQHFLRYSIRKTWSDLDSLRIKQDSSFQFTEGMGFSSGISTSYPLFDIVKRQKTGVIEIPLLIMRKLNQELSHEEFLEKSKTILGKADQYNTHYMTLFHNSDVDTLEDQVLYDSILQLMSKG